MSKLVLWGAVQGKTKISRPSSKWLDEVGKELGVNCWRSTATYREREVENCGAGKIGLTNLGETLSKISLDCIIEQNYHN